MKFFWRRVKVRRKKPDSQKFLEYKEKARTLVLERLLHFNQHYKFTYGRVSIRNQTSRWGSCSSKGNLNFNYKIALIPPELADYIVVHELCHRGQFNHSQKFWDLVGEVLPEYEKLKEDLRKIQL